MKKTKKQPGGADNLFYALALIILGVLFMILKGSAISIAMTVLGVALIILAVIDLTKKLYTPAAVKGIAGAVVILLGWLIVSVVLYVAAALLLIYGILQLVDALKYRMVSKDVWAKVRLYGKPVLYILVGIILLISQAAAVDLLFLIAGIIAVVCGVVLAIGELAK